MDKVNKSILSFISKMCTNASGNKTDSDVSMKKVRLTYYLDLYEFIKTSSKDFGLC